MSFPSRTKILPDRVPLSSEDLNAFSQAFREDARRQGLTVQQSCRYEAWVLAFLAWCHEKPSRRLEPECIAAFRSALREEGTVEREAVTEAMDALSFLFGTAQNARDRLVADRQEDSGGRESHSEKKILSLQANWQDGNDCPEQDDPTGGSSEAAGETDDGSTAEHCLEQFQSQLETLHSGGGEAEEAAKEKGNQ